MTIRLIGLLTILCLPAASALAGVPDPGNSTVVHGGGTGVLFVNPGAPPASAVTYDDIIVTVRAINGAPLEGVLVLLDFSGCSTLCVDPNGVHQGITDASGQVIINPSVGGCEDCTVQIVANGVPLWASTRVVSTDWDGSLGDGFVDCNDQYFWRDAFFNLATEDCADYNANGSVDVADLVIFSTAYSAGDRNTSGCLGEVIVNEFIVQPLPGRREFVELANLTPAPVEITGWTVEVDAVPIVGFSGTLSPGTVVVDSSFAPGSIPDLGGVIVLRDDQGEQRHLVRYGAEGCAPISCPRVVVTNPPAPGGPLSPDAATTGCGGTTQVQTSTNYSPGGTGSNYNVGSPTPGAGNASETAQLGTSVRLTTVYAAGSGDDGVGLYNPTGSSVDISNWNVSDGSLIEPVYCLGGVNPLLPGQLQELRQGDPGSFTIELGAGGVLYLYDPDLTRLDQLGWARVPSYFPDSCMVRIPDGSGPADGFDWFTSGGDQNLFYLPCDLQLPPATGIDDSPVLSALAAPFPNPARDLTTITFTVGGGIGTERRAELALYDVSGRKVRVLTSGIVRPGPYRILWDGTDRRGARVPDGIYFVRLRLDGERIGGSRALVWLR